MRFILLAVGLAACLVADELDDEAGLDDQIGVAVAWAEELLHAAGFASPGTAGA